MASSCWASIDFIDLGQKSMNGSITGQNVYSSAKIAPF